MIHETSSKAAAGTISGVRISAIIEIGIFFIGGVLFDITLGEGNRFEHLSPHPFWIIILLVTVQYGVAESLLSAVVASGCLLIGNIPEQHMMENIYDYLFRVLYLPLLWIGVATVLGAIRSRQLYEGKEKETALYQAERRSEAIAAAYQCLKNAKENLELCLAEEMRSSIVVYEAAKALETIDQRELLKAAKNILITTLSPVKFSIYLLRPTGLEYVACYGWEKQEEYVLSFPLSSRLYKTIVHEKRVICSVNEADEALLSNQGIMAGPIVDTHSKEVFGMLKIEETGIMGANMRNVEIFRILCGWIGMAYANTKKYQLAVNNNGMIYTHLTAPKLGFQSHNCSLANEP